MKGGNIHTPLEQTHTSLTSSGRLNVHFSLKAFKVDLFGFDVCLTELNQDNATQHNTTNTTQQRGKMRRAERKDTDVICGPLLHHISGVLLF